MVESMEIMIYNRQGQRGGRVKKADFCVLGFYPRLMKKVGRRSKKLAKAFLTAGLY
jgi:hypothetical protein